MRLQLAALVGCLLVALPATADEASGTWTGEIEGRGNYYWERSTRVVVPTFGARVTAPSGVRVHADYLVDVITSASIAQTGSDDDDLFTEYRHGVGGGIGKEFDLGGTQLDLAADIIYSTENDYTSFIYGVNGIVSLNERNTLLKLGIMRLDDTITSNADVNFEETLSGVTLRSEIEQVINPVLVLSYGYQLGYLTGFTANAYRLAPVNPIPVPENHPDQRFRHTAFGHVRYHLPDTDTSIHLIHSAYVDNWDIAALAPELRVYQQWHANFLTRVRYRFYTQTAAFFAPTITGGRFGYPQGTTGFVTNDPKMTEFTTHTLGLRAEIGLAFFEGTFMDWAAAGTIDLDFDRIWNDNAYGNGVIAQLGGRLPF